MSDGVKEKKTCWKKGWSIIKPSPELIFDFTLVTTLLEIGFIYRQTSVNPVHNAQVCYFNNVCLMFLVF
jgi:hypothetical protein